MSRTLYFLIKNMTIKKIKLAFMINRETFRIEIEGKSIWYADRRWGRAIRLIPKDENFLKKLLFSRGKIPPILKELFTLTKTEQEEYDNAKDAVELAEICKRDCRRRGSKILKEEVIMEEANEDDDATTLRSEDDSDDHTEVKTNGRS